MGVREGGDPKDLGQAGWGAIFADDADPAVERALQPLLTLRREQAGTYFRIYSGSAGFRISEDDKRTFLARSGVGPGPADPARMPYYLLIVGSPDKIPYRFQSQLDVQYAVGRIAFETPDQYTAYAESVVLAETRRSASNRLAVVGVTHPDDLQTRLAAQHFTRPLMEMLADRFPQWTQQRLTGEYATKRALLELLRTNAPLSILLCAGHGIAFPPADPRQAAHQGALLCADWPGPKEWSGPLPPELYFSADDLTEDMNMAGMIAFLLASYSGGTPELNELELHNDSRARSCKRAPIAPRPFLAALPVAMLGRPRGALAVVGYVERAWGSSFMWSKLDTQTVVFENTLRRLLDGHPLGSALEPLSERYAELATRLSEELEDLKFGKQAEPDELAGLWTAHNDMRSLALIGDPAVRVTPGSTR